MKSFDIIIIGGCSSGLAAAINASRLFPGLKIAVLERLPRVGKKLLATGNGRCNLSNLGAAGHEYRNAAFAERVLAKYPPEKTLGFFKSLGLITFADEEGRVYPLSNTAASVLDSLRFALDPEKITVLCDYEAVTLKKSKNVFTVNGELTAKKIILCCGGRASPAQGSAGGGYALARQLGHSVTQTVPSLVPLKADEAVTRPLKGVRIHHARLSLESAGRVLTSTEGELLFTDTGISGIAAMELASSLERDKLNGVKQEYFTDIDFIPDMSYNELVDYLKNLCASSTLRDAGSVLGGLLPKAAGAAICKAAKLYKPDEQLSALSERDIKAIASAAKKYKLKTTGTRGFDFAQVTSGGVPVDEIDPETMESLKCSGLFFAGELIDVDGGCGGFNLQWAWSSGLLAGELGEKI